MADNPLFAGAKKIEVDREGGVHQVFILLFSTSLRDGFQPASSHSVSNRQVIDEDELSDRRMTVVRSQGGRRVPSHLASQTAQPPVSVASAPPVVRPTVRRDVQPPVQPQVSVASAPPVVRPTVRRDVQPPVQPPVSVASAPPVVRPTVRRDVQPPAVSTAAAPMGEAAPPPRPPKALDSALPAALPPKSFVSPERSQYAGRQQATIDPLFGGGAPLPSSSAPALPER